MDEIKRDRYESLSEFRARYRKANRLGAHKKGSAKARNKRDRPENAAHGICLVCGLNRLKCVCSGDMSEDAKHRFTEEQKKASTPQQSGFG